MLAGNFSFLGTYSHNKCFFTRSRIFGEHSERVQPSADENHMRSDNALFRKFNVLKFFHADRKFKVQDIESLVTTAWGTFRSWPVRFHAWQAAIVSVVTTCFQFKRKIDQSRYCRIQAADILMQVVRNIVEKYTPSSLALEYHYRFVFWWDSFQTSAAHGISWLRVLFLCDFLHSFPANSRRIPRLGHDCYLKFLNSSFSYCPAIQHYIA